VRNIFYELVLGHPSVIKCIEISSPAHLKRVQTLRPLWWWWVRVANAKMN